MTSFLKFTPSKERCFVTNKPYADKNTIGEGYINAASIAAYDRHNKVVLLTTGDKLLGSLSAPDPMDLFNPENYAARSKETKTIVPAQHGQSALLFKKSNQTDRNGYALKGEVSQFDIIAWRIDEDSTIPAQPVLAGFVGNLSKHSVYVCNNNGTVTAPDGETQLNDINDAIQHFEGKLAREYDLPKEVGDVRKVSGFAPVVSTSTSGRDFMPPSTNPSSMRAGDNTLDERFGYP